MAIRINLLRASSLGELEKIINDFIIASQEEDARVQVDLVGGITFINDENGLLVYVAPMRISASHKRSFDETPGVPRFEQ